MNAATNAADACAKANNLAGNLSLDITRLECFTTMLRRIIDDVSLRDEDSVADGLARVDSVAFALDALIVALRGHVDTAASIAVRGAA